MAPQILHTTIKKSVIEPHTSLDRGRILITSPALVPTTMLLPTASKTSTDSVFLTYSKGLFDYYTSCKC